MLVASWSVGERVASDALHVLCKYHRAPTNAKAQQPRYVRTAGIAKILTTGLPRCCDPWDFHGLPLLATSRAWGWLVGCHLSPQVRAGGFSLPPGLACPVRLLPYSALPPPPLNHANANQYLHKPQTLSHFHQRSL